MLQKTNRKELVSISLDRKDVNILRIHANAISRSLSETIRIIIHRYIEQGKLEEKYSKN